jgi:hypothetical protein
MLDKMQATQESMQVSLDKLAPLAPSGGSIGGDSGQRDLHAIIGV